MISNPSSLSLEEIELIAVVYWISYVSIFLRLFMMSFKYGLIILSYFSTDRVFFSVTATVIFNLIVTPKITYSYWFRTIFFFMIKKVPNIFNYFIFNCCIFFFSLKRFLISLIVASSISFFTLKWFFKYLIMLFYIFYLSQAMNFLSLYVVKKIH